MSTTGTGRVLVATSGSAASSAAVVRATREAAVRGTSLHVVHVIPPDLSAGPAGYWAEPALRTAGDDVLATARSLAHDTDASVEVTTTVLGGARADAVVHAVDGAELAVVGAPPHDLAGRLWTGSTVMGIVARAACPVLVVPADGDRNAALVVVGLKSREGCGDLLRTAFALAHQTHSELRIVHAWHLTTPYEDAIAERLPSPRWEQAELRAIENETTDLRMTYPEVQVQVAVVHGQPGRILVGESRDAGLVVISRPVHGGFAHHLGTAARQVVRDARCPVLVVPPARLAGSEPVVPQAATDGTSLAS